MKCEPQGKYDKPSLPKENKIKCFFKFLPKKDESNPLLIIKFVENIVDFINIFKERMMSS